MLGLEEGAASRPDPRPMPTRVCLVTATTESFVPGTMVTVGSFLKHHPDYDGDVVVIEKARQWDRARIIPIGGLVGLSGPSRVPCLPLRTCGAPAFVLIPASIPARPSAHVLELPFYGAGS